MIDFQSVDAVDKFTLEEQQEIFRLLQQPREHRSEIIELLQSIDSPAEIASIRNHIQRMVCAEEERDEAASGLIKADVLQWSPNRICNTTNNYRRKKYELAYLIGYTLKNTISCFPDQTNDIFI